MMFRINSTLLVLGASLLASSQWMQAQASTGAPPLTSDTPTQAQPGGEAKAVDLGGVAPATVSGQGGSLFNSELGLCQVGKELSTNLALTAGPTNSIPTSVLPPGPGRTAIDGFPFTTNIVSGLLNQNRPRAEYQCQTK